MAIEAPISKFKKNGLLIYIAVALAFTAWLTYDGYFNKNFIEEHTDENGKPDSSLVFNQKAWPFGVAIALFFGVYFVVIRNKKLVADENELIISQTKKIPYDSIERIDKTHFKEKGFFVLTYKDQSGTKVECRISNRRYDNLQAVLNHLVGKIT
ncbi:MAG: hypothetical protein ACYS8Z_08190 [Planctomycetota bacterium]|jgi:hypothetical protein